MLRTLFFSLLLLCAAVSFAAAQETPPPPDPAAQLAAADQPGLDWLDPATIGPLDADLGVFADADLSAWEQAAQAAYAAADYETAIRYSLALLRWDSGDTQLLYQLACCYGLLGNAELAAKYLSRAVAAGMTDLNWASWDPDFEKVRGQAAFDSTFAALESAAAEAEAARGTVQYLNAEAFMRCRVFLPDGYDPAKSYPLVVGLHGYGASPENFAKLWTRFQKHNFIFAIPQAPYAQIEGSDIGYSWQLPVDESVDPAGRLAHEQSEAYVARVAAQLREQYHASAVYLLGFSQGCAMTYATGIKYHEQFDGLVCFAGWLDTEWLTAEQIAAAKPLRVFIGQGLQDRLIVPEESQKAYDTLKQLGYDVTLFTYEAEHRVPPEATAAAEAWLAFE